MIFDPNNPIDAALLDFYQKAKSLCILRGFVDEMKHVESLKFENQTPGTFLNQYVYVVLNSGISNKAAESMLSKLLEAEDVDVIKHPYKRDAIKSALRSYNTWFNELKQADTIKAKLEYLDSLPMIGAATKYHLARNLGLDVAKPDRHLIRIAEKFSRSDIQDMCKTLSSTTGDRIGLVDVILWRACEQGIMREPQAVRP